MQGRIIDISGCQALGKRPDTQPAKPTNTEADPPSACARAQRGVLQAAPEPGRQRLGTDVGDSASSEAEVQLPEARRQRGGDGGEGAVAGLRGVELQAEALEAAGQAPSDGHGAIADAAASRAALPAKETPSQRRLDQRANSSSAVCQL